jgi:DNA-binding IclR family transcriptional regulator
VIGEENQALGRFVRLLSVLGGAEEPLTASQLAQRAGLPTSSTYRLVQALARQGLVDRRDGISLGLRILELAHRAEEHLERALLEPARPVMSQLAAEHRETVLLTAPLMTSSIGLYCVESPRPIRLSYARWSLAPLHRGASGKVLLAFLDPERAQQVLALAVAGEAGPDVGRLSGELAAIRQRGHVITHGELDEGASGVAAPVLDSRGELVAGLTVAGPTQRIGPAEPAIVDAVMAAASRIGSAL